MKIRPITDHIVVKRDETVDHADKITAGSEAAKAPSTGVVVAVGPGKLDENAHPRLIAAAYKTMDAKEESDGVAENTMIIATTRPPCEVGDRIVYATYAGSPMDIDGEEVLILQFDDVMAVLENSIDIEA